jgi:iron complex outermembrane receptor protein
MDIAADVTYTDSTTGAVEPANATDDYTIFGARLGLGAADGKWRAMLWGRNLTDEDYYPAAYQGGNGPYIRVQGMPLTYGVTISYFTGQ